MHVQEAKRQLGTRIPWICDSMDNALKHALGNAPNSELIIDAQGRVVVSRAWSEPELLRRDLMRLVGGVSVPTPVSELDYLRPVRVVKPAATGVVPRITVPRNMMPLKVEALPGEDGQPFYAKLRVEAEQGLLRSGKGSIYLGFYLDPLYHVHWNNLAEPLRFTLSDIKNLTIEHRSGKGPQPKEEADADPREFLLKVRDARLDAQFELTVDYFACNDAEGWCKPVRQSYRITVASDRDGGTRRTMMRSKRP